ncbi:Sec23-binding domain of Sec16-domain-containing protein [Thamnocephalis sphaerospora]|uniref:Protein transport protein sec16 n=1 Tax=Thamnocephalis sphaerospora TaxID=78915 RepID=A0A4P9XYB9_9FUNG|nr:Sec23-binding domain of Sec16-domain-containing protein [Thamnocephalis sphaerospora]|eukprot:RKP10430.1 Sec23-binding domain of Sec16-domain-containing protein [Thamnocephalis sphaerospora]
MADHLPKLLDVSAEPALSKSARKKKKRKGKKHGNADAELAEGPRSPLISAAPAPAPDQPSCGLDSHTDDAAVDATQADEPVAALDEPAIVAELEPTVETSETAVEDAPSSIDELLSHEHVAQSSSSVNSPAAVAEAVAAAVAVADPEPMQEPDAPSIVEAALDAAFDGTAHSNVSVSCDTTAKVLADPLEQVSQSATDTVASVAAQVDIAAADTECAADAGALLEVEASSEQEVASAVTSAVETLLDTCELPAPHLPAKLHIIAAAPSDAISPARSSGQPMPDTPASGFFGRDWQPPSDFDQMPLIEESEDHVEVTSTSLEHSTTVVTSTTVVSTVIASDHLADIPWSTSTAGDDAASAFDLSGSDAPWDRTSDLDASCHQPSAQSLAKSAQEESMPPAAAVAQSANVEAPSTDDTPSTPVPTPDPAPVAASTDTTATVPVSTQGASAPLASLDTLLAQSAPAVSQDALFGQLTPRVENADASQLFADGGDSLFDSFGAANDVATPSASAFFDNIGNAQPEVTAAPAAAASQPAAPADIWAALSRDYGDEDMLLGSDDDDDTVPLAQLEHAPAQTETTANAGAAATTPYAPMSTTLSGENSAQTYTGYNAYSSTTATSTSAYSASAYGQYTQHSQSPYAGYATTAATTTTTAQTSAASAAAEPAAPAESTDGFAYDGPPVLYTRKVSSVQARATPSTAYGQSYYGQNNVAGYGQPSYAQFGATTVSTAPSTAEETPKAPEHQDDYAYDGPPVDFFTKTTRTHRHAHATYATAASPLPQTPQPPPPLSQQSQQSQQSTQQQAYGGNQAVKAAEQHDDYAYDGPPVDFFTKAARTHRHSHAAATAQSPQQQQQQQAYGGYAASLSAYGAQSAVSTYATDAFGQTSAVSMGHQASSLVSNGSAPPSSQPQQQQQAYNSPYASTAYPPQSSPSVQADTQAAAESTSYSHSSYYGQQQQQQQQQQATTTATSMVTTAENQTSQVQEYPGWTYDYTTQQWVPEQAAEPVAQNQPQEYPGYRYDPVTNQYLPIADEVAEVTAAAAAAETAKATDMASTQQENAYPGYRYDYELGQWVQDESTLVPPPQQQEQQQYQQYQQDHQYQQSLAADTGFALTSYEAQSTTVVSNASAVASPPPQQQQEQQPQQEQEHRYSATFTEQQFAQGEFSVNGVSSWESGYDDVGTAQFADETKNTASAATGTTPAIAQIQAEVEEEDNVAPPPPPTNFSDGLSVSISEPPTLATIFESQMTPVETQAPPVNFSGESLGMATQQQTFSPPPKAKAEDASQEPGKETSNQPSLLSTDDVVDEVDIRDPTLLQSAVGVFGELVGAAGFQTGVAAHKTPTSSGEELLHSRSDVTGADDLDDLIFGGEEDGQRQQPAYTSAPRQPTYAAYQPPATHSAYLHERPVLSESPPPQQPSQEMTMHTIENPDDDVYYKSFLYGSTGNGTGNANASEPQRADSVYTWSDVGAPSHADDTTSMQTTSYTQGGYTQEMDWGSSSQEFAYSKAPSDASASVPPSSTYTADISRRDSQYSYSTELVSASMYGSEFSTVAHPYTGSVTNASVTSVDQTSAYSPSAATAAVAGSVYAAAGAAAAYGGIGVQEQTPVSHTSPYAAQTPSQYPSQPYADYSAPAQAADTLPRDMHAEAAIRPACPLVAFGFGGRLVTMFPRVVQRFSADQATPVTRVLPGQIIVQSLSDHLPAADDLSQVCTPVLQDQKMSVKAKKKEVVAYLSEKIDQTEKLSAQTLDATLRQRFEAQSLLWKILKLLCDHDGHLPGSGNEAVDAECRSILLPPEEAADNSVASGVMSNAAEPVASPQKLHQIEQLLLRGDRAGAVAVAVNNKLWSHALVLASCVGKDVWKETVSSFLRDQLAATASNEGLRVAYGLFAGFGRQAVDRVLSNEDVDNQASEPGQFSTAAELAASATETTVFTPGKAQNVPAQEASLNRWRTILCTIVANRTPADHVAISSLGDALCRAGQIEAAHLCFLLSPQTSVMNGLDTSSVRMVLMGADHQQLSYCKNTEALRMTEVLEFALSLRSSGNGSGGFPHLQAYKLAYAWALQDQGHLQASLRYCEAIAACVKSYAKGSPYLHSCFTEQLREMNQRVAVCTGGSSSATAADSAASWISKLPKPTLGSLINAIDNGISKFVAGDEDGTASGAAGAGGMTRRRKDTGPFASGGQFHSRPNSPQTLPIRSASVDVAYGGHRAGSPYSRRSSQSSVYGASAGMHRSSTTSQALPYAPRYSVAASSPLVHASSLTDTTTQSIPPTTLQPAAPYGQEQSPEAGAPSAWSSPYGHYGADTTSAAAPTVPLYAASAVDQEDKPSATTTVGYTNGAGHTPFYQVAESTTGAQDGDEQQQQQPTYGATSQQQPRFYSPADNSTPSWWDSNATSSIVTSGDSQPSTATYGYSNGGYADNTNHASTNQGAGGYGEEDDDDFGLGNSSLRKKAPPPTSEGSAVKNESEPVKKAEAPPPASKNTPAESDKGDDKKGWSIWGLFRPGSASGAKQAKLGGDNAFYYDAEQKRWVNRNADPADAAPPPPPPPPPPASSAPATRMTTPAGVPPAPPTAASTPGGVPPPPMGGLAAAGIPPAMSPPSMTPPVAGTPGKKRRGARNRYVDVMAQGS